MKFNNISGLCVLSVVTIVFGGALLGSVEARADTASTEQAINGDTVLADETAAQPESQPRKKKKRRSKRICTREKVTGSHMRQRVCRTQEQIDARRDADQRLMNDIVPTGGGASSGGG